jgi:hypothetical protein
MSKHARESERKIENERECVGKVRTERHPGPHGVLPHQGRSTGSAPESARNRARTPDMASYLPA